MQSLTAKAEQYFQELARDKEETQAACFYINRSIDEALAQSKNATQDISLLLSLIPYIESGVGALSYKYIGETHRILRILHIIKLEQKYRMPLFCFGCTDQHSLIQKYMLSLFAFRRLLFKLSDASAEDAVLYLQQNRLSVFAVYIITQDDLILPDEAFFIKITDLYAGLWSMEEIELFHSLTHPQ